MIIKNARVFDTDGFTSRDIYINGDRFAQSADSGKVIDAGGCYAAPGLIDIHFHGCIRYDFSSAQIEEMNRMARYQAKNGITAICPATMTLPEAVLAEACGRMTRCGCADGAELAGIYLEGPFLSPQKPGAQNPIHVRAPDAGMFRRLQEAAAGLVKILAFAPEQEGATRLLEEISGEVRCSIAHTTADYVTASRALKAGARQVTHLYNAMPPFNHREPGVIGAALDSPGCNVELICDNVHVHPSVVRATFRMFGKDRIILVSDSMMATGLDDGEYVLGDLPVTVRGNTARLTNGGAIAGSVTNLMNCVRTAVSMGIPLHTAIQCASANPAKAIGIDHIRGSIAAGKIADLILLGEDLSIKSVILRGKELCK